MMGWLRRLLARPCLHSEVAQAAQVNHSANRLLATAAQEQSIHSKCVEYQAKSHIRDEQPAASQTLSHLVDFMARKPDAPSR
jgi:hypothetical protein